jgi:uncharacterized protein YqjF (DUF2071 family)
VPDRDFDYSILEEVGHRPWPMPSGPWAMTQTWHELLFAHWPVDPVALRAKVPRHFELDLFDGVAWLAVVPFRMANVGLRGVPALPWVSEFPEVNVRTYVRVGEKPGVFFFSLDAASRLAVWTARSMLNLPYFAASMSVSGEGDGFRYHSGRSGHAGDAVLDATYRPSGPPSEPAVGSLEHFLTERYCLYHVNRRGRPYRIDIHHPPWPLQTAEAEFTRNTMAAAAGLSLADSTPLLHFSRRQDVVAWLPEEPTR